MTPPVRYLPVPAGCHLEVTLSHRVGARAPAKSVEERVVNDFCCKVFSVTDSSPSLRVPHRPV